MNIKSFIKIFSIAITFLIISIQAWSVENPNILSEVMVTNQDNGSYTLNLFFNNTFKGRSFLQKESNGVYSVFIPDTATSKKNIKVSYKISKDMPKIKVDVSQNPFIKDGKKNAYTKLTIKMDDTYSLRLSAQKYDNTSGVKNIVKILSILLLLALTKAIFSFRKLFSAQNFQNTYTILPKNHEFLKQESEFISKDEVPADYIPEQPKVMPVTNPSKALKTVGKDSFRCFDVPMSKADNNLDYEIRSNIKQTSVITNQNLRTTTSPISRAYVEDTSEFSMPCINDAEFKVLDKNTPLEKKQEKRTDIISELRLTPTKGLYLRYVDEQYILYGAIGRKAYVLRRFNSLDQTTIKARFYDQDSKNDIYIVRLDSYKAMIEISDTGMKELAVL